MRLVFLVWLATAGCRDAVAHEPALELDPLPASTASSSNINPRLLRRFKSVQRTEGVVEMVELGKHLFFEPRLSRDGKVSCNTCHPLDRGGADGKAVSLGVDGRPGRRNAPTVFNAARHVAQFWDGRAPDLATQAKGPLLSRDEMDMGQPARVTSVLRAVRGYAPLFTAAFPGEPDAIDFTHATEALAAFEATLMTPSRWDRFLDGDTKALSGPELEGLRVFGNLGCVQCHTGELVGGKMYQPVGLTKPWPNQKDQGRYELSHQESDRMMFKVPSLRNVALTAPYFHDGSVSDLGEAIKLMGSHQLDLEISDRDVTSITAWLGTLTGEPGSRDLHPPTLPR